MLEEFVLHWGYAGLFAASFMAATVIPLGSEAFVILMAVSGFDPGAVFAVALAGNTLGAVLNYYAGRWGDRLLISRYFKIDSLKRQRAQRAFARWGTPFLFFAWVPIIGDPLTIVAGALKVRLAPFVGWVALGKGFRYFLLLKAVAMVSPGPAN